MAKRVVSSTFKIVQILVYSHLVSWLLALEVTELVSEPVTQMAVELINIHLISVQQKGYVYNLHSFLCKNHNR